MQCPPRKETRSPSGKCVHRAARSRTYCRPDKREGLKKTRATTSKAFWAAGNRRAGACADSRLHCLPEPHETQRSVESREAPVDNEGVSPHKHRLADYLRPKTLSMLLLGFSSGLPFYLVGNTFGFWLRDEHTSLTAIGFLSWVGLAYSLKFLWAPLIDRVAFPLFKRLGHRPGWLMVSPIYVGLALSAMGGTGPQAGLGRLGALARTPAFAASTQDVFGRA